MSTWTQYVNQTVPNGASGTTLTWPVRFLSVPIAVQLWLVAPNGFAPAVAVVASAVTTSGCAATFSDALTEDGYVLQGQVTAQQASPQTSGCGCAPSTLTPCVNRPVTQGDTVEIPSGDDTIEVTFPIAFGGVPSVVAMVIKADADHSNIAVVGYTVTATGFIASLGAPTDDDTYQLSYVATYTP